MQKFITSLFVVFVFLGCYTIAASYLDLWPFTPAETFLSSPTPTPSPQALQYRNTLFGFVIPLPESWRGYTVNHIKEDMYSINDRSMKNNGVVDSFQIIELHHPLESATTPRARMPVMVFTPLQWDHIMREEWSVGAAPFPPTELGRNSKYILALPARYNYDFKPGWEEVDRLIHLLQAFEPTP